MKCALRVSRIRLVAGGVLLGLALLTAFFVLPNASLQKFQKQKAADAAKNTLAAQNEKLAALEAEDQKFTLNRKHLEALLGSMPNQSAGTLQWGLSQKLYELAKKNNIRLQSMKYGAPAREESKGTDLEVLDVEFNAIGVYQNIKPFMLGLEDTQKSQFPFAVVNARLEESPDGARLSVTLRAFRRSGNVLPKEGP
jgi:hypothetical protein